jgi:hypothetical protein
MSRCLISLLDRPTDGLRRGTSHKQTQPILNESKHGVCGRLRAIALARAGRRWHGEKHAACAPPLRQQPLSLSPSELIGPMARASHRLRYDPVALLAAPNVPNRSLADRRASGRRARGNGPVGMRCAQPTCAGMRRLGSGHGSAKEDNPFGKSTSELLVGWPRRRHVLSLIPSDSQGLDLESGSPRGDTPLALRSASLRLRSFSFLSIFSSSSVLSHGLIDHAFSLSRASQSSSSF